MSVDKHVDIGDAFDVLLRSELSVEPSPAFLPHVRERIAAVPQRTWRFHWILAATAAAAVSVVAIGGGLLDRSSTPPPAAPGAPLIARAPVHPGPARVDPQQRTSRAPVRRAVSAPGTHPVVGQSEVIVDQRQRAALATLMSLIDDGRLTNEAFARTQPHSLDPIKQHIVPVGVAPVAVNALEFDGVLQKGIERK